MSRFSVIKLSGLTPTHIGTGRESYDFSSSCLHSDTISAALASIMALQGKADGIEHFLSSFRISSAFPFYRDHLFMPVPHGRINVSITGKEESNIRKSLKKIRYMEYPLWQRMICGEHITVEHSQINGECLMSSTSLIPDEIYKSEVSERVCVPRGDGQDSEPFYFEWKYFKKEAGLFVLTDATGDILDQVLDNFQLLGQQGIGTDKSIGGGKFSVSLSGEMEIIPPEKPSGVMLLSLYLPSKSDIETIDLDSSSYSIILRGGYMAGSSYEKIRHLRKRSLYMFDTGSVFITSNMLDGRIEDLRPEWNDSDMHPAYRNGRPLQIPI